MKLFKSKIFTFVAALVVTAQLLTACAPITQAPPQEPTSSGSTTKTDPLVFQQTMRKLWEDHITWTRVYIIDVAADLPEADASAERLLQNQVDIGDAIKPLPESGPGETSS